VVKEVTGAASIFKYIEAQRNRYTGTTTCPPPEPTNAVASELKIPPEVSQAMSRLLRDCPSCGGYGSRPPIVLLPYQGTPDSCAICGPVRNWFWSALGIEFECLT
jgi:hypothetical protein